MQNSPSEPVRVLRTAAWIWIGYLSALVCMDLYIYYGRPMQPVRAIRGIAAHLRSRPRRQPAFGRPNQGKLRSKLENQPWERHRTQFAVPRRRQ